MNRWNMAGIGEFVGVLFYTASQEFYGIRNISDLAFMLGFGLPFALIGFVIGMLLERKKS
ncbi:MAG: hypothetical protein LRY72_17020 [Saccharospirillaceae bacterium]|nr:hypothetical protein [Saccharospirillaceae bacterium]